MSIDLLKFCFYSVESLTTIMDVSIVSPKTPFYRPVFSAIGEKQEEDLLAES